HDALPICKGPSSRGHQEPNRWSGRRELNPRLRPWQGRTLPLSYSRSAAPIINEASERGKMPSRLGKPEELAARCRFVCFLASHEGLVHWGASRNIFARLEGRPLQNRRGTSP